MYTVKADDKPVATSEIPGIALLHGVAHVAKTGEDALLIDGDGVVYYDLEADSKVDDDDLTYPVIVHTRAILVGMNA